MADGIKDKVAIIGMGCTRFGERWESSAEDLMIEAFLECLADAGIEKKEIEAAYLGSHYKVTEYYHPTKNSALDDQIRKTRCRMGIALLPHTDRSVQLLTDRLKDGQLVALCPDQQPRLRAGLFVPFFGVDALTAKVVPRLLQHSNARLIWAYTERLPDGRGFRLRFAELDCCSSHSDEEILRAVSLSFQSCIETNPAQYRWADKRFNIRPTGRTKVYHT